MRIFNIEKTKELFNVDESKGRLYNDTLITGYTEEVEGVEPEGHYETIKEYPNGGKDVKWVVDKEGVKYKPSEPIIEEIKVYVPYTERQLLEMELDEMEMWFKDYDLQVMQFNRCQRLGEKFDKDMSALDLEAKEKAKRIKELRKILGGEK